MVNLNKWKYLLGRGINKEKSNKREVFNILFLSNTTKSVRKETNLFHRIMQEKIFI